MIWLGVTTEVPPKEQDPNISYFWLARPERMDPSSSSYITRNNLIVSSLFSIPSFPARQRQVM